MNAAEASEGSGFEKLQAIGEGSYGKCWLVKCSLNKRRYALKEVRVAGLSENEVEIAVNEVKILGLISHFNVIRYKKAFVRENTLNIITEYADAGTLYDTIKNAKGTRFPENVVVNWMVQIGFALKYLHSKKILHRDLKSQNIFLTSFNIIKVGDFGISKLLQNTQEKAQTSIGTPYYLSPEIYEQRAYDQKSDIWAFGCLIYEIAMLKQAFDPTDGSLANLIVRVTSCEYGPLPRHYAFTPISSIIEMCLQYKPEDRPTADAILRLPDLRPHIIKYERIAAKVIRIKNTKESPPSAQRSAISEDRQKEKRSPQISPNESLKRRSPSLDSPLKKAKSDSLRKAVILRQALNRSSSMGTTYSVSPPRSDTPRIEEGEGGGDQATAEPDDVFEDMTAAMLPIPGNQLEPFRDLVIHARRVDMRQSDVLRAALLKNCGAEAFDNMVVVVSSYMQNCADEAIPCPPISDLMEHIELELHQYINLAMLLWFLEG